MRKKKARNLTCRGCFYLRDGACQKWGGKCAAGDPSCGFYIRPDQARRRWPYLGNNENEVK